MDPPHVAGSERMLLASEPDVGRMSTTDGAPASPDPDDAGLDLPEDDTQLFAQLVSGDGTGDDDIASYGPDSPMRNELGEESVDSPGGGSSRGSEEEEEADDMDGGQSQAEMMAELRQVLLMRGYQPRADVPPPPLLESFDLAGVARYIRERDCRKIVLLCGAGISVSAGIPDFRTPGTGLYDNLQKYDLPSPQASARIASADQPQKHHIASACAMRRWPQAIFEMGYFRERPDAFYQLAAELYPS